MWVCACTYPPPPKHTHTEASPTQGIVAPSFQLLKPRIWLTFLLISLALIQSIKKPLALPSEYVQSSASPNHSAAITSLNFHPLPLGCYIWFLRVILAVLQPLAYSLSMQQLDDLSIPEGVLPAQWLSIQLRSSLQQTSKPWYIWTPVPYLILIQSPSTCYCFYPPPSTLATRLGLYQGRHVPPWSLSPNWVLYLWFLFPTYLLY